MIKNLFSVSRCWHPVRSKPGPGFLHSHSAVKLQGWMVLFGGEREGQTVNEVWRFHFGEFTNTLQFTNSRVEHSWVLESIIEGPNAFFLCMEATPNRAFPRMEATPNMTFSCMENIPNRTFPKRKPPTSVLMP